MIIRATTERRRASRPGSTKSSRSAPPEDGQSEDYLSLVVELSALPVGMLPDPYDDVDLIDQLERADARESNYADLSSRLTLVENGSVRRQVDRILAIQARSSANTEHTNS